MSPGGFLLRLIAQWHLGLQQCVVEQPLASARSVVASLFACLKLVSAFDNYQPAADSLPALALNPESVLLFRLIAFADYEFIHSDRFSIFLQSYPTAARSR